MKKILIIILLLNTFISSSQIVVDSLKRLNCYHDGAIFLDVLLGSQVDWYFYTDSIGWIDATTIPSVQFSNNLATLTTQQCGNYKVVTSHFFFGVDSAEIFVNCPLGSRGSQMNVKCFGDSTGTLKRVAHSGSPPYNYEVFKDDIFYSSGPDDTLFFQLGVGSYKIVFTDAIGCSDSILTNLVAPPLLSIDTIFTNDINCRGVNSGSVHFSVSGGRKYLSGEEYDYYLIDVNSSDTVSWLTRDSLSFNFYSVFGSSENTFDSLFAGDYRLCLVDSFGCFSDVLFELNQPIDYIAYGSTADILICESDSGYLQIDSVIGDSVLGSNNINFGFAYDTVNGVYMDSIYAPSGWYDIYVYDSTYFCLDTVLIRCEALYEIKVFEQITPVRCFGELSGSIVIDSINGGNAPYDVQWGGVDSSALSAGSYLIYIVDSIGCLHTENYIVHEGDQVNANERLYYPTCYGDANGSISIGVSGGTGMLSYYWLNGTGTADSLYALSADIYNLVVNDSLGCVDTFHFNLENPLLLSVDITSPDSTLDCFGALTIIDAVISGGVPPYSIIWSDGDTNQQRIVGSGYYEVEIMDANDCVSNESIIIVEPEQLEIVLTHTNIGCINGATANVTATGGTPPISYLWSTGDTTSTIDSLWNLTYWVLVTDSCGISVADTIFLDYYELNTLVYYDDLTHIAEIEIENTTSIGPFEYTWLNIFGDSIGKGEMSPVLCEGTYFVTTYDLLNDCSVTDTLLVDFSLPSSIIDISTTTVYADSNLWGFPPYSYLWSNGENTIHADICPGNHWIEVTDINNCMVREEFTVKSILITLDPSSSIIECDLENLDLDLEVSATGGVEPYSFQWWNGSKDNPINLGLFPGKFSVSVVDGNGCIEDTSFIIAVLTSECVPNVFTPNGDGINDVWNLEDTFLYEDSEVSVYGRFGRLIFSSVGYNIPWDGTNSKGKTVPDGAYFYSIDIGSGFDPILGTVTILR